MVEFFVLLAYLYSFTFFFSSRRRHTRSLCDWSSDVGSSDLTARGAWTCTFSGGPPGWSWAARASTAARRPLGGTVAGAGRAGIALRDELGRLVRVGLAEVPHDLELRLAQLVARHVARPRHGRELRVHVRVVLQHERVVARRALELLLGQGGEPADVRGGAAL